MPKSTLKFEDYTFNAKSDSADFRDHIYQPKLIQLAKNIEPDINCIVIRDQGQEGACTGFGLSAVIDYMNKLRHQSGVIDDFERVSSRMLYEMARQHDQWPGEEYSGSSARGAMKGWSKNGVCTEKAWRYRVKSRGHLTYKRQLVALKYPLGAYSRILKNRTAMQAALNEVPAIFVTASVHKGWQSPRNGKITYSEEPIGGHAFAVVGYNSEGFIVQNSWGDEWGGMAIGDRKQKGLAIWTYKDFEKNMKDAWVARMALPLESMEYMGGYGFAETGSGTARIEKSPPRHEIMRHYVHIDDGCYDPHGNYPTRKEEVPEIIAHILKEDHVLFYAHGGLNTIKGCAQRTAKWRNTFKNNKIGEVHFIWETGLFAEIRDVLFGKQKHAEERAGFGASDWWDSLLETLSHPLGQPIWNEMISDADIAFDKISAAGSDFLKKFIAAYNALPKSKQPKIHLVGHSAGSIWFSHILKRWSKLNGPTISNLVLFAPACTVDLFKSHIRPLLTNGKVKKLSHFLLNDEREKDDNVGHIYRKSLLYLVSNSFQKNTSKLFGKSAPIMGMQKFEKNLKKAASGVKITTYVAGKNDDDTQSMSHGGFDNDLTTMNRMLKILCGDNIVEFVKEDMKDY